VTWEEAEAVLLGNPGVLEEMTALLAREGRLTVIGEENGEILFAETSLECPGTKSIAYDRAAQDLLKGHQRETCQGNAMELASPFRAELLPPELYGVLKQAVPGLDARTWTWLLADEATRAQGFGMDCGGGNSVPTPYLAKDHSHLRGARLLKRVRKVQE